MYWKRRLSSLPIFLLAQSIMNCVQVPSCTIATSLAIAAAPTCLIHPLRGSLVFALPLPSSLGATDRSAVPTLMRLVGSLPLSAAFVFGSRPADHCLRGYTQRCCRCPCRCRCRCRCCCGLLLIVASVSVEYGSRYRYF